MTPSEVTRILAYLGRIIPRGDHEEKELLSLIHSLTNATSRRKEKHAA